MLAENEPENNLTKSKWNYLESLVDKANEVFKVPKRTNYLDSDNSDGYVSKEESQKRISMIFISLALLLNVVLVSLIVLHLEVTKENQTQMIFHDYEDKEGPKMPLKTLTIINSGKDTIQNIAFDKKGSLTLLNYYKMVDDWSYMFMFPHVTREVFRVSHFAYKNVRVYKQLDKERILAQTYRKDNIPIGPFSTGVQIGDFFWIFGGTLSGNNDGTHHLVKESVLYHILKKTWVKGPDLPENIFFMDAPSVSLNSSHAVIFGANVDYFELLNEDDDDKFKENYFLTLVYDFQLNIWINWAKLPIAQPEIHLGLLYDYIIKSISAVVYDDKYGNRQILVMVEHNDYPNVRLFAMDITNFDNQWIVHDTSIASDKDSSSGRLAIFNGVLVYVNYLHMNDRIGFIKYYKSNLSSWSPLIVKGYNRINKTNNLNNLHLPRLITFQCYI